MNDKEFDNDEIIEALQRSGYLLESEISKFLSQASFFVESNQVILDPITGKNREIDLIAEYYDWDKPIGKSKCCAKIRFVFEIKNNNTPFVLLTEYQFTPTIEDWVGLKEKITIPKGIQYDSFESYYKELIHSNKFSVFTQYCSFQRKKEKSKELMAIHPDNVASGLDKIVQYCEVKFEERETIENPDGYFRHFINIPILLIADNLFELQLTENNQPILTKVDSSILISNYHDENREPTMAFVFVVTKKGLESFIQYMLELEKKIQTELELIRIKHQPI